MTGIPLQLPNVGQPQVIQGGGTPDPYATILAALMQGMEQGQSAYQFQQQMKLRQGQMELDRQQEERIARETDMKRTVATATGEGIRAVLANQTLPTPAVGGLVPSMPGLPLTTEGPEGMSTQMAGTVPGLGGIPGASPTMGAMPSSDPFAALNSVLPYLPPQAVGPVVEAVRGPLLDRGKAQEQLARKNQIQSTIDSLPTEKQKGARALLTYAEAGANLPKEVQQSLWPELFPPDKLIDPAVLNAGISMFRTGAATWGQVRREFGIPSNGQIPDDVKFTPPSLLLANMRQGKAMSQAANFLTQMQTADPIIDGLIQQTGGLSFLGQLKKEGSTSGGNKGIFQTIRDMAVNKMISAEQQQLVTQMQNFSNAWRFAISGASSSDKEFVQILNASTEAVGDAPETKRLKSQMRKVMIQGVADIANGVRTPTQVLDNALRLNFSPEQKAWLMRERGVAAKFERDLEGDVAPFPITDDPPSSPDDFTSQQEELQALLRRRRRTP
jgi:hypothetical protein